ncbi:MAG: SUMF1/EgtB/PvdO family nonheme iron enzyme [Candidatus Latescibacteria bacterium]|nr:SUMF1/EgtB/PvdO family nonheme iron enzyme [Candidatus Latescibacterota bacterium]
MRHKFQLSKIIVSLFMLTVLTAHSVEARDPQWLQLDPPLTLSDEGFRGVKWCTLLKDIPWEWDALYTYPTACHVRKQEDYTVFGQKAKYLTYTFRNTVFYGVRIDFVGREAVRAAQNLCLKEYPPADNIEKVNDREARWNTASTYVLVTLPETNDGLGQIYLWGKDRKFGDDSKSLVYLAKPPSLNYTGKKYQPRHYVIYRASAPITIDGDINEKAWQDAAWSDAFEDHQSPYAPEPWKMTRVKMLYDDDYMYFAARLQEENVWGHITKRDSIVYYDNDFELFLDPTANSVDYFEFELTCLNTMFDMFHENDNNRGALADRRYDSPGTRHAVQIQGTLNYHYDTDEGWTVEVKIPFADLASWNPNMSLPVRRGDMWRVEFSRVEYLHIYNQLFPYLLPYSRCEDWVWNTVHSGSIHVPEMWGKALFSDMYAGAVKDEELERGFILLEPPKPPKKLKKGMVHFPACTMTLGPDPTDTKHSPAHNVDVPEFRMDRYEVTVDEYTEFLNKGGNDEYYESRMAIPELCGIVKDGPGKYRVIPGRENYPVVFVQQQWALAYAESQGKTLPTEAMWERAAIGADGRAYPWGNEPLDPSRANYDFHYGGALPVGSFPEGATPEGLYDMTGNAREWTISKINPYPGGAEYEYHIEPWWYPGMERFDRIWWVARGGGWTQQEGCMSPKYRNSMNVMDGGIRCVRVE